MHTSFVLSLFFVNVSVHAVTIFVDLNDAPKEYDACVRAIGQDNVKVVNPSTINVRNRAVGGKEISRIGKASVERIIAEVEASGETVDQLVISGHDGSGHFMGSNGDFYSEDLRQILDAHPKTKATLATVGLVGCYPNNKHGANTYWLAASKNVKQTVGFPVQSPTKEKSDTGTMIGEYCKNGKEWASQQSKDELCKIYPNFARLIPNQLVSICSREAVASTGYGKAMCYTNEELDARCKDFDPDDKMLSMYEKYFSASNPCEPDFANPPVDKNAFYAAGASPLRKFYSQVHLWKHCADTFRRERKRKDQTDAAYNMPDPPQMIRLIKYDDIKQNVASLNKRELADYDQRLKDVCLGQFALGDITKLNRAEMNRRIEGAFLSLHTFNAGGPSTVGWIDEPEMYEPAQPVNPADVAGGSSRAPASAVFLNDVVDDDTPVSAPVKKKTAPAAAVPKLAPAAPVSAPPVAPVQRRAIAPSVAVTPPAIEATAPPPPPAPVQAQPVQAKAQRPAQCGRPVPPSPEPCDSAKSDPDVVEKMAAMMKYTMVDLNYKRGSQQTGDYRSCLHFHLVEPEADRRYKSQCIVDYNEASKL